MRFPQPLVALQPDSHSQPTTLRAGHKVGPAPVVTEVGAFNMSTPDSDGTSR